MLVLNTDGLVILEFSLPNGWSGYGIEGTIVRLDDTPGEDPYLAVLAGSWAAWDRSVLLVFSTSGDLVYEEILGEGEGLLTTQLPHADAAGESLLVSDGPGKVVRYYRPKE